MPTKTNKSFSIIIPAFNEGDWPKRTLDGILADYSYKDYEVILVDDGSTDHSFDFLCEPVYQAFLDSKKITLIRTEDSGTAGARHIGAKYAQNEVLIFLDAHMQIENGWLSQINHTLNKNPRIKLLTGTVYDLSSRNPLKQNTAIYTSSDYKFSTGSWLYPQKKIEEGIFKIPFLIANFFIIDKKIYFKIGGFLACIKGWGPEDRTLSMIAYYHGYYSYKDPILSIGHYFKKVTDISDDQQNKKSLMGYNRLACSYLLYNRDYHRRIIEEEKQSPNFSQNWELFSLEKPKLYALKKQLKRVRKKTFQNFKNEFNHFLGFFAISDYYQALKLRSDNPQKAINLLKKSAKLKYSFSHHQKEEFLSTVYFRLAQLYQNMDHQKALKYAYQSFQINPTYLPLLELFGIIYTSLKQGQKAIPFLVAALERLFQNENSNNKYDQDEYYEIELNLYDLLAEAYLQNNEIQNSTTTLKKALELEPSSLERQQKYELLTADKNTFSDYEKLIAAKNIHAPLYLLKKNPQKASIIIKHFCDPLLPLTIDSIIKTSQDLRFEIIIVDDHSDPQFLEFLKQKKYHQYHIQVFIPETKLRHVEHALNIGSQIAKYPNLIFMDSHILLQNGCIASLIEALHSHKDYTIATCQVNNLKSPCRLPVIYRLYYGDFSCECLRMLNPQKIIESNVAIAAFFAIKKSRLKYIGGFEKHVRGLSFSDIGFCLQDWLLGGKLIYLRDYQYFHYFKKAHERSTFAKSHNGFEGLLNRMIYIFVSFETSQKEKYFNKFYQENSHTFLGALKEMESFSDLENRCKEFQKKRQRDFSEHQNYFAYLYTKETGQAQSRQIHT